MAKDNVARDESNDGGAVSRRKLLKMGTATAIVGTAGCSGDSGTDETTTTTTDDGGGDDTTTTTTAAGDPIDSTFTAHFGRARPTEVHFNPFNSKNTLTAGLNSPQHVLYDQLMEYNAQTGEWMNQLLSEFSVDGTTVTLQFDDSYAWNNGDPVRARDYVTQIQIGEFLEFSLWEAIDSAEVVDQQTAELTLSEPSNPGVVRQQVNRKLITKHEEFSQWLEDYQDASNQDEIDSVTGELTSWQYAAADEDKHPAANGPFQIENISSERILTVPNEHYPLETNIPEYEFLYRPESQSYQAMLAGDLDGAAITIQEQSVMDQYPDQMKRVDLPEFGVTALYLQNDHEMFQHREVRQAFAYLLDTERVVANSNPRVAPLEALAWLSDGQAQNWLGDMYDSFTQYFPGSQPEKAAELMREAGFQKDGGTWVNSDGESFEFSVKTPGWSAPLGVAKTTADTLSEFGIQTNVQQQEASNWVSDADTGDFTLRGGYFGGGPHPFFGLEQLQGSNLQACNVALEAEIPMPVGDPSGSTETVNAEEKLQQLATTSDSAEAQQLVQELAWFVNQTVPSIPLTNGFIPSWYSTDHWTFPDPEEDPDMYLPQPLNEMLKVPQEGTNRAKLQAKTE